MGMNGELDRLSCLPSEVTEKILLHLSTREAVRTSVLSSKWRYKWAKLPCLSIDEKSISSATLHSEIVNIVDHLLLLHIGPLHKFVLAHHNVQGTQDFDRWILHLSRNSIREVILGVPSWHNYQLPSSLFSCRDMISLRLFHCLLKFPSSVMGYLSLENISLHCVKLSQDEVERLIDCCPLLQVLRLICCCNVALLKVDAPKLRVFHFDGFFVDLCFEHTLNLRDVNVALSYKYVDQREASDSSSNLVKFLLQLPHIEILRIRRCFLKYLKVGSSPLMLPQPCLYLHTLHLHIQFQESEIISALCILRNSPALTDLCILAYDTGSDVVVELHDDFLFPKLRNVEFYDLSGVQAELDFIKLLLSSSPVLEKMTITHARVHNSTKLLMKLIRYKRASKDAEIIFLDK